MNLSWVDLEVLSDTTDSLMHLKLDVYALYLLLKDGVPLSEMLSTASSGTLFQTWTAVLMKVLPEYGMFLRWALPEQGMH